MIKIKLALFLSMLSSVVALASDTPRWSLEDTTLGWNSTSLARLYFHNSEFQRQWAFELLGKEPILGHEKILDFGCGDGKITSQLSWLVSRGGSVLGVDISEEMIRLSSSKFPPYAYPNLHYKKSDSLNFDDFPVNEEYDLITSFCVFHLVPDPLPVLKNLKKLLKPTGKLLLVIPAGKNPALFQAAGELFIKYQLPVPWANQETSAATTIRTVAGAKEMLQTAGFRPVVVEMIDTATPFYDTDELIAWMIGTMSANWNIPESLSLSFFSELAERICELDPQIVDENGVVHFKLSRIHVIATCDLL
jgi:trans-aconitate 2-methyltransferase